MIRYANVFLEGECLVRPFPVLAVASTGRRLERARAQVSVSARDSHSSATAGAFILPTRHHLPECPLAAPCRIRRVTNHSALCRLGCPKAFFLRSAATALHALTLPFSLLKPTAILLPSHPRSTFPPSPSPSCCLELQPLPTNTTRNTFRSLTTLLSLI